jgi:hypothetical protein
MVRLFRTAIIWRDMKQVVRLQKHQQAVWAVRCVGTDRFLTGKLLGGMMRRFTVATNALHVVQALPIVSSTSSTSLDKCYGRFPAILTVSGRCP